MIFNLRVASAMKVICLFSADRESFTNNKKISYLSKITFIIIFLKFISNHEDIYIYIWWVSISVVVRSRRNSLLMLVRTCSLCGGLNHIIFRNLDLLCRRLRWKAFFYDNQNEHEPNSNRRFGFKSEKIHPCARTSLTYRNGKAQLQLFT